MAPSKPYREVPGLFRIPMRIIENDKAFFDHLRKAHSDDPIDVEFKVIEEPKQIGDGTK